MRPTAVRLLREGFLKRNLDVLNQYTSQALSVGGLERPWPDLTLVSFRDPLSLDRIKTFSDRGIGGFSTVKMEAIPFSSTELPADVEPPRRTSDPLPHYAKFSGNISIELPKDRRGVERSGFAAWRTADPAWTIFGRQNFNCESHAFLALRVKSDHSKYFINLQPDSMVVSDLYQHRLFPKTPGEWETIYVPFAEFVKTSQGKIIKQRGSMPKNSIKSVGLGLIDRIPGPFQICIDKIWATNTREIENEAVEGDPTEGI